MWRGTFKIISKKNFFKLFTSLKYGDCNSGNALKCYALQIFAPSSPPPE
jgi:hypothetical protein